MQKEIFNSQHSSEFSNKVWTDELDWPSCRSICKDECTLGKELKVPVYRFLKEPLIRAYGPKFYAELEKVESELKKQDELKD